MAKNQKLKTNLNDKWYVFLIVLGSASSVTTLAGVMAFSIKAAFNTDPTLGIAIAGLCGLINFGILTLLTRYLERLINGR